MNIYIILLILTIAITLGNSIIAFRRRNIPGAKSLILLNAAVAVYAFGYIFEITVNSLETKLIWYGIEYFGIAALPFLWLFFALQYSDNDRLIINKKIYYLAIIPVITILLVWTNRFHGLMIQNVGISTGIVQEISKTGGIWYWVNIVYTYGMTITGSLLLINTVIKLPMAHIKQGLVLAIGALIPIIGSLIYITNSLSIGELDLTPFSCAISGMFFLWSLSRLKMLQIVPIARDKVFDSIEDAIIVVNPGGIIIDFNRKTREIFEVGSDDLVGQNLEIFLITKNIKFKVTDTGIKTESPAIKNSRKKSYYSITSLPVEKKQGKLAGYLVVLSDITQSKKAEINLSQSKKKIEGLNRLAFDLSMVEADEDVCKKSSQAAREIMGFIYCSFFVEKEGSLVNGYNSSPAIANLVSDNNFFNDFVAGTYKSKKTEVIKTGDFHENIRKQAVEMLNISAVLCMPVSDLGAVFLFGDTEEVFSSENIRLTELLVGHSAESLKRLWLQKSLRQQAELDSLTGVYNRRYFNNLIEREVERSRRFRYPLTLAMIDVDRFKEINDRYGHQVGDLVLKGIADVIGSQIRKVDTLVRYGGDEFLIVLPESSGKGIDAFIKRLRKAVSEWNSQTRLADFEITVSIGISSYDPAFNEPVDKIIHYADMDMYRDKKDRKNSL
jgi:diguanylate cyclase (GGDEF)-like protein/PAS domain S-box-containing protein